MKIKELKEFIKNLPDDMDVYVEYNFNNRYDVEKDIEHLETGSIQNEDTGIINDALFIRISME